VVWSVLDRHRREYTKLHRWLRVLLRFSLGFTMCVYGAAKVIKSQFPFPHYERLLEPYGMSSPMALLWTFMGYSMPYNVFAGAGEMLAGILVFFRRTTTVGALLGIAVLSNVVMLNFSYDVPVKLFSSMLLLMSIFLVLPDARRLIDAFLLNRPVAPRTMLPLFSARWKNRAAVAGGVLFAAWSVFATLRQSAQGRRSAQPGSAVAGRHRGRRFGAREPATAAGQLAAARQPGIPLDQRVAVQPLTSSYGTGLFSIHTRFPQAGRASPIEVRRRRLARIQSMKRSRTSGAGSGQAS
jgi:uncharacterized membrane protein YphA (DoxX/SURF4 family)